MMVLRSLLFNLGFFGVTTVLCLVGWPFLFAAPMRVVWFARLWIRSVMWMLRVFCRIDVQVSGREHIPDGPGLVAAKHQSAFDTLIWMLLLPRPAIVLKKELLRVPIYGGLLKRAGMIAVDRGAGASAMRRLMHDAEAAMADGRQILIFPEGTRSAPGERGVYQPGIAALAARCAVPVVPAATNSGLFWGRRSFRKQPGTIRIAILPPLPVGMKRTEFMQKLADEIETATAKLLDKPVENSVGSCRLSL